MELETDTILAWLASKASAETLLILTVVILFAVEAAKRVLVRVPAWPKDFSDWWFLGGALGVGLGLWQVEVSLAGAAVGLVCGTLATGGFEYLRRAGNVLSGGGAGAGTAKTAVLLALGISLVLSTAGCGGPWIRPDDETSLAAAEADLEAGVRAATLLLLDAEEASPEACVALCAALLATDTAVGDPNDANLDAAIQGAAQALQTAREIRLFEIVMGRLAERLRDWANRLDLSADEEALRDAWRRLAVAALRGAGMGCRDAAEIRGGLKGPSQGTQDGLLAIASAGRAALETPPSAGKVATGPGQVAWLKRGEAA